MTKRDCLPLGPRGHHIANLYLTIIDNDPINKQFHQLATLGEGQVVQRWPEAGAESGEAKRQSQDTGLPVRLDLELPGLVAPTLRGLCHPRPFALEFLAADDLRQTDAEEARA